MPEVHKVPGRHYSTAKTIGANLVQSVRVTVQTLQIVTGTRKLFTSQPFKRLHVAIIGGRLTEPWSILIEPQSEQLTE